MSVEVTVKLNDVSVTTRTESDSVEDCAELAAANMSMVYGYTIDLLIYEEVEDDEEDNIYCEGVEPLEEREIDGL